MKPVLHIIASCTDRKRSDGSPPLRLRDIAAQHQAERARAWAKTVHAFTGTRVRAEDLYVGDHWWVVKSLLEIGQAQGFDPHLWVLSAGYGFIPGAAEIAPYSATFAQGHPDSITGASKSPFRQMLMQQWWESLSTIGIQESQLPRTLTNLASQTPEACFLIVASPTYLFALERDITQARERLRSSDQLVIVSSGSALSRGPLGTNLLATEAKLSSVLGGASSSLNARVARTLLRQTTSNEFSCQKLGIAYQELLARTPTPPPLKRTPMTDNQVRALIETALESTPGISYTPLLRSLRDNGQACEYGRFKALFEEMKGTYACRA